MRASAFPKFGSPSQRRLRDISPSRAGEGRFARLYCSAIEAAKVIRDFAKDNKALVIKGAAADGTVYDAEGAKKLADLKSRPQLLAEFAGDIKASMAKAAYLFNALPTKAVRTIDALREKQEKAA